MNIQEVVKKFLYTLTTGSTNFSEMESCSPRTLRLKLSLGQDLIFAVRGGRQRLPKQISLPYAVKSLTNNVELIQSLIQCGHGVAYSQLEEINTALCLPKIAATPGNEVPLPENIRPFAGTPDSRLGQHRSSRRNSVWWGHRPPSQWYCNASFAF